MLFEALFENFVVDKVIVYLRYAQSEVKK